MIALAWHQKFRSDYPLTKSECVNLMRLGWIEVKDDEVYKKIITIQNKLKKVGLDFMESYDRKWFRISISKENIFFNRYFFRYKLVWPEEERWELKLFVDQLDTPIGNIPSTEFTCAIESEKRYQYLKAVAEGKPIEDIVEILGDPKEASGRS